MNRRCAPSEPVLPTPVGPRNRQHADRAIGVLEPRATAQRVATASTASSWPMTRLLQALLHVDQLATSPQSGARTGAGPLGDDPRRRPRVDHPEGKSPAAASPRRLDLPSASSGISAVAQIGGALEVGPRDRPLAIGARLPRRS